MQVEKAKEIDPLTVAYYNYQTICYYLSGNYDLAIELLSEAIKLYPAVIRLYDFLGRVYLTTKEFKKAAEALERGLNGTQIRPPSMIAFLAIAYLGIDQPEKASGLLNELTKRSDNAEKGVNFYLVHLYIAMGDQAAARSWLEKAKQTNDIDLIWLKVDPLLEGLDNVDYRDSAKPDFIAAEKHILQLLEEKLPTLAYHNLEHITDVLQSSMMIADAEKITDEDRALLRLAVLLHDSGFIYGTNDHELRSTKIAWELLPQFGLSELQIKSICAMIMATKIPQQPNNQLEKIICDADLDYLGREDFTDISQRLYEELKAQGIAQTEREWNLVQKTFFESHQYHTEFSKTNRANLKAIHFEKILISLKNRT